MSSDESFLVSILGALAAARLEALIVGSTAAVLQGAPVMTQDVELLIRDTPVNRERLGRVAEALGGGQPVRVSPLTSTLRLVGLSVGIDVLFDQIAGDMSFQSLRARNVAVPIGDAVAHVASLEDVIVSKEAAGRPKDQAQLPILRDTLRVKTAADLDADSNAS